jgi:formate hydrogenlyase subunit 3/multisubunit Na+/H+ antiporter MnhD subunit
MTLIAFLLVCVFGMLLGLLAQPYARLSRLVAIGSVAGALMAALLINPDDTTTVGEVQLAASWFVGFFLTALAASCLLLCLIGLLTGWPERLAPAALAMLAGVGIAISSTDPTVTVGAAAAATAPAALVASRIRSTPLGVTVGIAEMRTLALVIAASLLAAVTILNTNWNSDDPTFVLALAFLVLAAAVAVRSGAVPFHVPAALLSRSGEGLGLVLSLVWIPTSFGLVALSWNASIFGVPGDWLDRAVVAVQVVAVSTLIFGAVGAMLHDEIEEIAVYSIVQDTGFVLLALTARDADAMPAARLWLLVFVIAKSALVAWVATASWAFQTSNLGELRGWLRRAPLLGLALVAIVVATLGWPGSAVFEARATLVQLGLPGWMDFLGLAAILLSLAYYARLLAVGLLPPTVAVRRAGADWPRWPRLPQLGHESADADAVARAVPASDDLPLGQAEPVAKPVEPEAEAEGVPPRRARFSIRHRLAMAWRLNRPFEASALVLATALIAAVVAFGGFGASGASQSGITLDQTTGLLPNPGGVESGSGPAAAPTAEPTSGTTLPPQPSTTTPSQSPSATAGASPAPDTGD